METCECQTDVATVPLAVFLHAEEGGDLGARDQARALPAGGKRTTVE